MHIVLNTNLGYNLNSLPDILFDFITGGTVNSASGVGFNITDARLAAFEAALNSQIPNQRRPPAPNGTVTFERAAEVGQAATPITPDPVEATAERESCDNHCEVCDDYCSDCDICLRDNSCSCEAVEINARDVTADGSSSTSIQSLSQKVKLSEDQVAIAIARRLSNDTANKADRLRSLSDQYSKRMSDLLSIQRQIDNLRAPIDSNPIVTKVIASIKELNEKDNLITDAYVTDTHIVIKTEDLVTVVLKDGKKRKIGKMEFYIEIKSLLGQGGAIIKIRNATREINGLMCGHVQSCGDVCFGNTYERIFKALVDYDMEAVSDSLIRFIRQPNVEDDWGRDIVNWPEEVTS